MKVLDVCIVLLATWATLLVRIATRIHRSQQVESESKVRDVDDAGLALCDYEVMSMKVTKHRTALCFERRCAKTQPRRPSCCDGGASYAPLA